MKILGEFWSRSRDNIMVPLIHCITCLCAIFLDPSHWPGEPGIIESLAEEMLTALDAWTTTIDTNPNCQFRLRSDYTGEGLSHPYAGKTTDLLKLPDTQRNKHQG